MNALILVLFCQAASVSAGSGFRLGLGTQVLGGYSRSPVITGPDSAPLLNLTPLAQGQYSYNLILSPGLTFHTQMRDFAFELAYTPRLYLDLQQLSNTPTFFNILGARIIAGRPQDWLLTVTPTLSLGGIGAGGIGSAVGTTFTGAAGKPGTDATTSNGSYASANIAVRLDHPFNRDWRFSTTELGSYMRTPGGGDTTDGTIAASGSLVQSTRRAESLNELHYRINSESELLYTGQVGWLEFPATASYASVLLSMGWDNQLSKRTKLHTRLGLMEYFTGAVPRQYNQHHFLGVLELGIEHTFSDWGLPRLRGGLAFAEGPYIDIVFGRLEPRATLTADVAYDFTHLLTGTLQVRDYTEEYFDGTRFTVIPLGHDKNVTIASAQLKYKYKSWLSYQGGLYSIFRWLVPTATDPTSQIQEYFFFVGAEGAYDLE